jgi:hypothetical protein
VSKVFFQIYTNFIKIHFKEMRNLNTSTFSAGDRQIFKCKYFFIRVADNLR